MAQTPAERKQAERARAKLKEEERLAALLAYHLKTPIFKGTAEKLERVMTVAGLDERDDAITRMINNIARMDDEQIADLLRSP